MPEKDFVYRFSYGCGNNVHIKCMKLHARNQQDEKAKNRHDSSQTVDCPLCRQNFGSLDVLHKEYQNITNAGSRPRGHLGVVCVGCHDTPIIGKCYKCSQCADVHLCQKCFNGTAFVHAQHSFLYREKMTQRWKEAPTRSTGVLPEAFLCKLETRDITADDYDQLLQLDNTNQPLSDLTEETIRSFPLSTMKKGNRLLADGQQCLVCLRCYAEGQLVRRLPCEHSFHKDCIDNWLLHRYPTCPVDNTTFSNEMARQLREAQRIKRSNASTKTLIRKVNPSEVAYQRNGFSRDQLRTIAASGDILLEAGCVGLPINRWTPVHGGLAGQGEAAHHMQTQGRAKLTRHDRFADRGVNGSNSQDKHGSRHEPAATPDIESDNVDGVSAIRDVFFQEGMVGHRLSSASSLPRTSEAGSCAHPLKSDQVLRDKKVSKKPVLYKNIDKRWLYGNNGLTSNSSNQTNGGPMATGFISLMAFAAHSVASDIEQSGSGHQLARQNSSQSMTSGGRPPSISMPRGASDVGLVVNPRTVGTAGQFADSAPCSNQSSGSHNVDSTNRQHTRLRPLYRPPRLTSLERGTSMPNVNIHPTSLYVGNMPSAPADLTGEAFVGAVQRGGRQVSRHGSDITATVERRVNPDL